MIKFWHYLEEKFPTWREAIDKRIHANKELFSTRVLPGITLCLLVITIISLISLSALKSEPEAQAPILLEISTADYDKLYVDYIEIQVKYGVLEAQYNSLKYNYEAVVEYAVADTTFKEQFETLAEQYKTLSVRYSRVQDSLYAVNSKEDSIINKYYPSDNETAKARWETFYEFWDSWWEEFEDNL